jgi:hypothetical protein
MPLQNVFDFIMKSYKCDLLEIVFEEIYGEEE